MQPMRTPLKTELGLAASSPRTPRGMTADAARMAVPPRKDLRVVRRSMVTMPTTRGDLFGRDTRGATATGTADGSVIFAKNSDRLPDECQHLRVYPSRDWKSGAAVRCQYVTLPQVRRTYRVLGSQPF